MTSLAAPVIECDANHVYRVDGQIKPNVTGVLKAVGVTVDFEALGERVATAALLKRDLGQAVHAALHFDDDDDLDEAGLDPQVRPYVEANRVFKALQKVKIVALETKLYHPIYDYVGQLDRVYGVDDHFVLTDFKLGDPWSCGAAYQTAAYQGCWDLLHPDQSISARWAVRLLPERTPPYQITRYIDYKDWSTWLACLATYHAQAERRPRR